MPLRLAFFGTPEFAVPTLERLIGGPHDVVVAVSQPDRRRGRGRRSSPAPVAQHALDAGIDLLRPERVGEPEVEARLRDHAPDLGVVVAFGQFIPKRIRECPGLGFLVNGHASLLPRHRGAAPIAHAILAGDVTTGISAMRVEREMDAGPVALQREIEIGPDENAGELGERLGRLAADVLEVVVDEIADDSATWTPQDASRATLAPKLEREDTRLRWDTDAAALARRVRAMAPSPGAYTTLEAEPLRILAADATADASNAAPGSLERHGDELRVATGAGWLVPRVLQRPGKRALPVDEFLRGRPIPDGARFV